MALPASTTFPPSPWHPPYIASYNAEAGPSRHILSSVNSGKTLFWGGDEEGEHAPVEGDDGQEGGQAADEQGHERLRSTTSPSSPPSLRQPFLLDLSLHPSSSPAFYVSRALVPADDKARQDIPVSLSLSLSDPIPAPQLDLELVGTLHVGGESRVMARVRGSLGGALAQCVELGRVETAPVGANESDGEVRAQVLQAGEYTLPLRVTVPTHTPLPPSYDVDASFQITYALRASLSSHSLPHGMTPLSVAELPFELLPSASPRHAPPNPPHSVWIPTSSGSTARWTLHSRLAGAAFSPTERIPIVLRVERPVAEGEHIVLVRAALVREERVSHDAASTVSTVVTTTSASARCTSDIEVELCLPIMTGPSWGYGYTTFAAAGDLRASAVFHVRLEVEIKCPEFSRPPFARCAPVCPARMWDDQAHARQTSTFTLPVEIGSVAEPPSAAHLHKWTDIEWSADGTGRLITGHALSCENGWIVAPPPYAEALSVAPYVLY